MKVESKNKRYVENTPGILEPRHKEEIFVLLEDPHSKPPVRHPLFVKARPYIKILQQHIEQPKYTNHNRFEEVYVRARAISAILGDQCIAHQEYDLPAGLNYYRFNIFCWYMGRAENKQELLTITNEEMMSLRQELVQKNPILQDISPYITSDTILDALFGCASQFAMEDILFFVSKWNKYGSKEKGDDFMTRTQGYRAAMDASRKYIASIYHNMPEYRMFVTSPHTINKVERHLGLPETTFPELD